MVVQICWINIQKTRASHCLFSVDVILLELTSNTFLLPMEEGLEKDYIEVSVLLHICMTKKMT